MKAEKKESIVDIRLTQIEANEDWTEEQRSDPILAKIIAAKEKDKLSTTNEIFAEGPLTKAYRALCDSLKLINRYIYVVLDWIANCTQCITAKGLVEVSCNNITRAHLSS